MGKMFSRVEIRRATAFLLAVLMFTSPGVEAASIAYASESLEEAADSNHEICVSYEQILNATDPRTWEDQHASDDDEDEKEENTEEEAVEEAVSEESTEEAVEETVSEESTEEEAVEEAVSEESTEEEAVEEAVSEESTEEETVEETVSEESTEEEAVEETVSEESTEEEAVEETVSEESAEEEAVEEAVSEESAEEEAVEETVSEENTNEENSNEVTSEETLVTETEDEEEDEEEELVIDKEILRKVERAGLELNEEAEEALLGTVLVDFYNEKDLGDDCVALLAAEQDDNDLVLVVFGEEEHPFEVKVLWEKGEDGEEDEWFDEYPVDTVYVAPETEEVEEVVEAVEEEIEVVFEERVNGTVIKAITKEGVFAEGTVMNVRLVENQEQLEVIADEVSNEKDSEVTTEMLTAVDITFTLDGEEVQPNGEVQIVFEDETITEETEVEVYHVEALAAAPMLMSLDEEETEFPEEVSVAIEEDEQAVFVSLDDMGAEAAQGEATFTTDHFSIYVFVKDFELFGDDKVHFSSCIAKVMGAGSDVSKWETISEDEEIAVEVKNNGKCKPDKLSVAEIYGYEYAKELYILDKDTDKIHKVKQLSYGDTWDTLEIACENGKNISMRNDGNAGVWGDTDYQLIFVYQPIVYTVSVGKVHYQDKAYQVQSLFVGSDNTIEGTVNKADYSEEWLNSDDVIEYIVNELNADNSKIDWANKFGRKIDLTKDTVTVSEVSVKGNHITVDVEINRYKPAQLNLTANVAVENGDTIEVELGKVANEAYTAADFASYEDDMMSGAELDDEYYYLDYANAEVVAGEDTVTLNVAAKLVREDITFTFTSEDENLTVDDVTFYDEIKKDINWTDLHTKVEERLALSNAYDIEWTDNTTGKVVVLTDEVEFSVMNRVFAKDGEMVSYNATHKVPRNTTNKAYRDSVVKAAAEEFFGWGEADFQIVWDSDTTGNVEREVVVYTFKNGETTELRALGVSHTTADLDAVKAEVAADFLASYTEANGKNADLYTLEWTAAEGEENTFEAEIKFNGKVVNIYVDGLLYEAKEVAVDAAVKASTPTDDSAVFKKLNGMVNEGFVATNYEHEVNTDWYDITWKVDGNNINGTIVEREYKLGFFIRHDGKNADKEGLNTPDAEYTPISNMANKTTFLGNPTSKKVVSYISGNSFKELVFPTDEKVFELLENVNGLKDADGNDVDGTLEGRYTVEWYVVKKESNGYHVDGRLVRNFETAEFVIDGVAVHSAEVGKDLESIDAAAVLGDKTTDELLADYAAKANGLDEAALAKLAHGSRYYHINWDNGTFEDGKWVVTGTLKNVMYGFKTSVSKNPFNVKENGSAANYVTIRAIKPNMTTYLGKPEKGEYGLVMGGMLEDEVVDVVAALGDSFNSEKLLPSDSEVFGKMQADVDAGKITDADGNIVTGKLTEDRYTVEWCQFKHFGQGYHLNGRLVAKFNAVTVTVDGNDYIVELGKDKNFADLTDAEKTTLVTTQCGVEIPEGKKLVWNGTEGSIVNIYNTVKFVIQGVEVYSNSNTVENIEDVDAAAVADMVDDMFAKADGNSAKEWTLIDKARKELKKQGIELKGGIDYYSINWVGENNENVTFADGVWTVVGTLEEKLYPVQYTLYNNEGVKVAEYTGTSINWIGGGNYFEDGKEIVNNTWEGVAFPQDADVFAAMSDAPNADVYTINWNSIMYSFGNKCYKVKGTLEKQQQTVKFTATFGEETKEFSTTVDIDVTVDKDMKALELFGLNNDEGKYILTWNEDGSKVVITEKVVDNDDNTPSGDTSSDDTPSGDTPSDDTPSGDTPSGDTPSDDTQSGDTPSDDTPRGDTPSDDTPSGDTPSDDTPSGDTPSGDTPSGDDDTTGNEGETDTDATTTTNSGSGSRRSHPSDRSGSSASSTPAASNTVNIADEATPLSSGPVAAATVVSIADEATPLSDGANVTNSSSNESTNGSFAEIGDENVPLADIPEFVEEETPSKMPAFITALASAAAMGILSFILLFFKRKKDEEDEQNA